MLENLALDKGTDAALGVSDNFDVFYLGVLGQMFAEHASKFWLFDARREAANLISAYSKPSGLPLTFRRKH
jgi:hypothetical protein